jgi:hypothetical protein
MTKPVVTKKKMSNLVDTETGEVLSPETTVNIKDENLVIVHSDQYVIIDSHALL